MTEPAPGTEDSGTDQRALMTCLACECITFLLDGDGVIECANCGSLILNDEVDWARRSRRNADPVREDVEGQVHVVQFLSQPTGYRKFLENVDVSREPLLVVVYPSGQVTTWGSHRSDDPYRDWLRRRLLTALDILTGQTREGREDD